MLQPEIRGLRDGDPFSWDCAFHWLWPIAWSAAHRRLAQFAHADIEDVAICAIREAAEMVQAGEVGSFKELKSLVGVVSERRALDHIRRMQAQRRASGVTESLEGQKHLAELAPGPLDQVNAKDLASLLMTLAEQLPEHAQGLLRFYYLEGLKQAEISERLGMPIGTVGVTLSRALESLRAELGRHPQLMKEFLEALR